MALFKKRIPHSDDSDDVLRILNEDTPFAIKEAFGTLRTNMLYLPIEGKCRKICVTSAFSGEGKTYVSVNLAISFADNMDGKKVLLIDTDMRKPRVKRLLRHQLQQSDDKSGLSEYLAGITDKPNYLKTSNENLFVLSSGTSNANPSGLINSSRTKKLFEDASEKFDYIIIDSPPVGIVTDPLIISSIISGYLIVTRADYSDVRSLSEVVNNIERVDGNILGIVLSETDPKKSKVNPKYNNYSNNEYD